MVGTRGRAEQGSIYPYEAKAGTRYRFTFRDDAGRQTTRRGFVTRVEAPEGAHAAQGSG